MIFSSHLQLLKSALLFAERNESQKHGKKCCLRVDFLLRHKSHIVPLANNEPSQSRIWGTNSCLRIDFVPKSASREQRTNKSGGLGSEKYTYSSLSKAFSAELRTTGMSSPVKSEAESNSRTSISTSSRSFSSSTMSHLLRKMRIYEIPA